ncbi:hypothetical protein V6N13_131979 [Hibiscus sabdariffa]|uniref:Uncharacterized protein n=1 Tax=Hibiscus sabdariffa TaxID=183260 RepID=A0ABR2NIU8_9ROSI
MGSGEKSSRNFHLHLPHLHNQGKKQTRDVPKGCLAIKVGSQGEEQQRFVVPVFYFNQPLFIQLLKEAEEEYGFDQKGTITIPCHVQDFRNVHVHVTYGSNTNELLALLSGCGGTIYARAWINQSQINRKHCGVGLRLCEVLLPFH